MTLQCCMVCGGDHAKEVCLSQMEKCANCKGHHKANSKECAFIRDAIITENERAYNKYNISMSQGNAFPTLSTVSNSAEMQVPSTFPGEIPQLRTSYSDRVKGTHNFNVRM